MDDYSQNKEAFLYPRSKYYGEFTPENLVFDANLQEFAQRTLICAIWKLMAKSVLKMPTSTSKVFGKS